MPNPPTFVPVKTLEEEQAAEQNLDAEVIAKAKAAQGEPAPKKATTPEEVKAGFQQFFNAAALEGEKQKILAAGDVAKRQAEAAKVDRPGDQIQMTEFEKGAVRDTSAAQAGMLADQEKAAAESAIPTVAKPLVAVAKGVGSAVENTAALAGVHPVTSFKETIPDVGGGTGALIQGVTQFAVGMKGFGAILGTGGGVAGSLGRQAVTDFSVFDAHAGNLADLMAAHPSLRGPITDYFASDGNDTELTGRLKNTLLGLGLGGVAEGFTAALSGTKRVFATRAAKGDAAAAKEASTLFEAHAATEAKAPTSAIPPLKGAPPTVDEMVESLSKPLPDSEPIWNGNRIATTDEVRTVLQKVGETAKAATDDGVQSLDHVSAAADELGAKHLEVREALAGIAPTVEKQNIVIQAARRTMNQIAVKVTEEARKLGQGVSTDRTVLNNHLANLQSIMETLLPARKAQARGLGQWRTIAGDEMSVQQIQDLIAANGDITKIRKLNEASLASKTFDAYMQLRVNALMSSPSSHARNIISNLFNAVLKPATRAVGAAGRAVVTGNTGPLNEALGHYAGLIHGFMDAARMAKMAWDVEAPILKGGSELGTRNAITAEKFGITPTSMLGQAVNAFGQISNLAGRGLGAADEFASQINYRANKYATLTREALDKGLDVAEHVSKGMDEAFDPLAIPGKGIVQGAGNDPKALQYALEATFQEQPGYLTQGAMAAAQAVPVIRSFVPFMKTLGNITRQGSEYTPAALASTHWWADLRAGGARRDEAVGKLVLGTGVTVTAGTMVHSGILTGAGPADPKLKAELMKTKWRPFSIKMGDHYVSYRGFIEPLGTTLAMVTSFFERAGGWDDNKKASLSAQVAGSVSDAMLSQTFAQGISQLFEAVSGTDDNKRDAFVRAWTASHVPAILNDVREVTDSTRRKPETWDEAIKNRIPWLSEDVPAAYDALGNKRLIDFGAGPEIFSPVTGPFLGLTKGPDESDPVLDEIAKLNLTPGVVQRFEKLNDQFVDLTKITNDKGQNAYDRWNELIAEKSSAGPGLRAILHAKITSKDYQNLSDEVKPGFDSARQIQIKGIIAAYRQQTRGMLGQEFPQLRDARNTAAKNEVEFIQNGSKGLKPLLGK